MPGIIDKANDVIDFVRSQSDECIVFCSLGKDSLVVLDMVYPHFKRVVCVFMYFVKGLEHIERWIGWLKSRYPKVEFMQVPHWNLTYVLRSGLYCVPDPKIKLFTLTDVVKAVRMKTGIKYAFLGMKMADGMNRRLMLKGYASQHFTNNGIAYPLAEWAQRDVLAYMRQHLLPEPIRYGKKASGGVGFNLECFRWMEENCPSDLERFYKVFPMSRRILWDYRRKHAEYGTK